MLHENAEDAGDGNNDDADDGLAKTKQNKSNKIQVGESASINL